MSDNGIWFTETTTTTTTTGLDNLTVFAVYANGEMANLYLNEEDAELACDDLTNLGVESSLEAVSVII